MEKTPVGNYTELMKVVRTRLDTIQRLKSFSFAESEFAAFHGRKIIESIAFGCLVAVKNGLKTIPKDAVGQYNAEKIFKKLIRQGIDVFPSPSEIRNATQDEKVKYSVKATVYGIPERRITKEELIKKYQRMHEWLHELNPYTKQGQETFHQANNEQLWKDLNEINLFLERHFISINGEAFYCTLRDKIDGQTKVISLSKLSNL